MTKKIAIVGAGWMAAYHVAGFRGAGAEVVAIVDKNPAAAKSASQKYGVDKTFDEPRELYAATAVDAPDRDSCHLVWIQFHEDLLATLGIPRGSDG